MAKAAAASAATAPIPWTIPEVWTGETAVCIGGGPSLNQAQVDHVRGKARVIAINDAYRLAPWADIVYACDHKWWRWHPGARDVPGIKATHSETAAREWPVVKWVKGDRNAKGLSRNPAYIHCGRNSGYQAINIAYLMGARRIVLIGYDMRVVGDRSHWFGDHPNRIRSNYRGWLTNYQTIADMLPALGLTIINATPGSALACFKRADLNGAL